MWCIVLFDHSNVWIPKQTKQKLKEKKAKKQICKTVPNCRGKWNKFQLEKKDPERKKERDRDTESQRQRHRQRERERERERESQS